MKVRHYGIVLLVLLAALLAGCVQQFQCAAPNVMVGQTCCLDADKSGVCDTDEPPVVKEEPQVVEEEPQVVEEAPSEIEVFAEKFARTWSAKSYTALHGLFDKDLRLRMTAQEFNFIARRMHASLGITSVSVLKMDGDDVSYQVMKGDDSETVVAKVVSEDGEYRHPVFYFFEDLDVNDACAGSGQCFYDFAKLTGNKNYCESAGDLRLDCLAEMGLSKTLTMKIDECKAISDYYARVECLDDVAVKENTAEPCWEAEYDKQMYMCMGLVVAKRGDPAEECASVVSSHGFPASRIQHAYCILAYVKETTDTDACDLINRGGDVVAGSLQEGCYNYRFP